MKPRIQTDQDGTRWLVYRDCRGITRRERLNEERPEPIPRPEYDELGREVHHRRRPQPPVHHDDCPF